MTEESKTVHGDPGVLTAPPNETRLVQHEPSGECEEAETDHNGVLRDEEGRSFAVGPYSIIAGDTDE